MSAGAAKDVLDKEEAARLIADWATEELGFRKKSTLVTAKGEEKIQAAELEPLLQGKLANILELFASHVVSSRNAEYTRHRLEEYCEQLGSTREDSPADLAYISLFTSVKHMRVKKQRLLSNIGGMHSQNSEAIQKISDLAAKKISVERHIRELRLRILMKQAMAENLRRMDSRVKELTKEMLPSSVLVQPSEISSEVPSDAVRSALFEPAPTKDMKLTPLEFLTAFMVKIKRAKVEFPDSYLEGSTSEESDGLRKEQKIVIAGIIACLKELEDRCVKMWREIQAAQESVDLKKSALVEKMEMVAGQLGTSSTATTPMAAENGPDALDVTEITKTMLRIAIRDTASHISEELSSLVPDLALQTRGIWSSSGGGEKTDQITQTVGRIQSLLINIKQNVSETKDLVLTDALAENNRFVKSLLYVDPREAWNTVDVWRLQHLAIDSSNPDNKIFKPADKLVTNSSQVEAGRLQKISGLYQAHVMESVRVSLAESRARVERLLMSEDSLVQHGSRTLEDTLDKLCTESKQKRSLARAAAKDWADKSNAEGILRLVSESEATEKRIAHLSETSGRLFTDSLAPWYKRDGVGYAKYLKQLKIARASEGH
ncbi:hypothetical protein IWW48_002236 [Coemansia sp. RSA 1200]|nr:hypothetical protein IWW48_002236 [Coemansia sp. RSA 1200]